MGEFVPFWIGWKLLLAGETLMMLTFLCDEK
jgi:hypothetical protein